MKLEYGIGSWKPIGKAVFVGILAFIKVFILPKPEFNGQITLEEIIEWTKANIASYKSEGFSPLE